ncbi:MAG TPA: GntR family transcriptional regulator [Parafilimonas sp.]|nr:GntR family transcriptional regulator [Parafilimonas sp.]
MQNLNARDILFEIDEERRTPKYLQIIDCITNAIKQNKLRKGDKILSINECSNEYSLSRDTVQRAYDVLEERGIISAIKGKGFYINSSDVATKYRILLLFNKISNYKKQIYNSFIETLGEDAVVDLKIHHCNAKVLEGLIMDNWYDYNYFVIMPHFYENIAEVYQLILKIPPEKLVILDKDLTDVNKNYTAVYQDFRNDIVEALESGLKILEKYKKLVLVHPKIIPYPFEIVMGFRNFCMQYNFSNQVIHEIKPGTKIEQHTAYIVIEETDLVQLIKNCKSQKLKIGKNVGIISYNETPLKEILINGITVISTDHAKMGETAAKLILENRREKIKNPFTLILRKSL